MKRTRRILSSVYVILLISISVPTFANGMGMEFGISSPKIPSMGEQYLNYADAYVRKENTSQVSGAFFTEPFKNELVAVVKPNDSKEVAVVHKGSPFDPNTALLIRIINFKNDIAQVRFVPKSHFFAVAFKGGEQEGGVPAVLVNALDGKIVRTLNPGVPNPYEGHTISFDPNIGLIITENISE